ncbi:putative porin, partial [Sphingomonas koreensis]|uniref:putative porin n=2 Tax=Sphingomonas koreensis TaxID=93064 RepID=UPI0010042569
AVIPLLPHAKIAAAFRIPGLDVGGDLRVRQEWNYGTARDRSRSVLRARVRASYAVNDRISIGAQLATGDPDDPNSTDVTLGNFADDLAASLDQAWIRYAHGGLTVQAGKFPQIFQRTDMVWDGDVSPQGVGAIYALDPGNGAKLDARALWFVIDEASVARDSDLLGGQLNAAAPLGPDLKLALAGSYYHYRLGSVAGADAGDFRGNLISGGRYRSDFHLIEGLGSLTYAGLSPRWPLAFTADYVRNLGAAVPGDTGFALEFAAGRIAQRGDWRIAYTYSEVQVDAVFAAFSHDNLDLSTNYRLHGVGLGYVPAPSLLVDLAWYHYRPLDARYTAAPLGWLDRVRLNFMVSF